MMNIFSSAPGKLKGFVRAEGAAKAALDEANERSAQARAAKETAVSALQAQVAELQKEFDSEGDPAKAGELRVLRASLDDVEHWHAERVKGSEDSQFKAQKAFDAHNAEASAARLLVGAASRAKEIHVLNKRLESVAAAVRKAPLAELADISSPELSSDLVRAEVLRLLPDVLSEEDGLRDLIQAGLDAYDKVELSAATLSVSRGIGLRDGGRHQELRFAKALSIRAASLTDSVQEALYENVQRALTDALESVNSALRDMSARREADARAKQKRELEEERERIAQKVAERREVIKQSFLKRIGEIDSIGAEVLDRLTPDNALRTVRTGGEVGVRERQQLGTLCGQKKMVWPSDDEWRALLAGRGLLWNRRLHQDLNGSEIVEERIEQDAVLERLVDLELREREQSAAPKVDLRAAE